MAVPNLSNVDWGRVQANQAMQAQNDFNLEFANALTNSAMKIKPVIQYDGSDLSFSSGDATPKSREDLWNTYTSNAKSWGIKPDTAKFENEILPFYKAKTTKSFMDSIYRMQLDPEVTQQDYTNLYRNNAEYRKMIEDTYVDALNSGDTQTRDSLHGLIPSGSGEGLVNFVTENPLLVAGGVAGGIGLKNMLKGTEKGAKASKFLKGKGGPLAIAAGIGIPMLAGSMGATEGEQRALQIAGGLGAGGYFGKQAFDNYMRPRYGEVVASASKSDLITRAKALGIDTKNLKTADEISEKIYEKTQKQSIRKTVKATGVKPFSKKAMTGYKFTNALPGWRGKALNALLFGATSLAE